MEFQRYFCLYQQNSRVHYKITTIQTHCILQLFRILYDMGNCLDLSNIQKS